MFDLFVSVFTFLGGLVAGVFFTVWKYRKYVALTIEDLVKAFSDGKVEFKEIVKLIIDAYSAYKMCDVREVAREVVEYLKGEFNVG